MTTFEQAPTLSRYLALRLATRSATRSKRRALPRTWVQAIVRLMMTLAGFACLTYAGFTFNMTLGWVIAGVSCFAFTWLQRDGQSGPTPDERLTR